MRAKSLTRLAAVLTVTCCGVLGLSASAALGIATPVSVAGHTFGLPPVFGFVNSVPSCSAGSALLNASDVEFTFTDGSGHFYGPTPNPQDSGGNFQGDGMLLADGVMVDQGHLHIWFNSNTNPNNTGSGSGNQQNYDGATISFQGSAVSFQGTFGGTTSASGHQSGWFHLKLTCL